MAKTRSLDEAMDKYKGGGGGFFGLENDKDTAVVRMLVGKELVPEEDWFVVHEIEVEGKKRWAQCTEESDCEFCRSGNKPQIKLFLQLVDEKDGETKVWERGRKFIPKITGLQSRYGALYNRLAEIQRNGKKGDTGTTYEIYPMDKDDKFDADKAAETKQKLLSEVDGNGLILRMSRDNMLLAIQGKYVPPKGDGQQQSNNSAPITRRENRQGADVF